MDPTSTIKQQHVLLFPRIDQPYLFTIQHTTDSSRKDSRLHSSSSIENKRKLAVNELLYISVERERECKAPSMNKVSHILSSSR